MRYAKATITVVGVLALVAVAWQARAVLLAVFLGLFLAAGLEPLVEKLVRWKMRRGLAVTVVVLGILALLALFLFLALQPAITEFGQLVKAVPTILDKFTAKADVAQRALDQLPHLIQSSATLVLGFLGGVMGAIVHAFTVLVLTIYFMLAFPRMRTTLESMLDRPERIDVARQAIGRIGGYVTGQITVCLCAGLASWLFLKIAGVPYAILLALTVAVFDAIPQVGATAAAVICVLVALTSSLGLAIATAIFFTAYQQFENVILAPKIFARSVSLSTTAVFVSVLFGMAIGGVLGAVLALPCTAALKVIMQYVGRARGWRWISTP